MKQLITICSLLFCYSLNAQNVGIGTLAPADKLHVLGGNMTIENGSSNFPWLSFRNGGGFTKAYIGVNNNDFRIGTWPGFNTTGHIALVTNNIDRMRVMADGLVGVGTTAPQSQLHVANITGATQFTIGTNYLSGGYTSLYMGTSSLSNGYSYLQSVRSAGNSFGDLVMNPSNGNVSIRTTTPRGIFDIGGANEAVYLASNTTTGNQRIAYLPGDIFLSPWNGTNISYLEARRENSSGTTAMQLRTYSNGAANDVVFLSGNKVGVNTNNIQGTLSIRQAGTGISIEPIDSDKEWHLSVFTEPSTLATAFVFIYDGTTPVALIANDGSYVQQSDARLKKNIRSLKNVLPQVLKLNPVTYQYKNLNNSDPDIGFLAQDVQPLFPSLVSEFKNTKGEMRLGINYAGFAVVAIKAIQEQQQEMEMLKKEIQELKLLLLKTQEQITAKSD